MTSCIKYHARPLQHCGLPLSSETSKYGPCASFILWIIPIPSSVGSRAVLQRPEVLSLYPQKSPPRPVHIPLAHFELPLNSRRIFHQLSPKVLSSHWAIFFIYHQSSLHSLWIRMAAPIAQQSTTIFGIVSDAIIPISHSPADINGLALNSSAITVDATSFWLSKLPIHREANTSFFLSNSNKFLRSNHDCKHHEEVVQQVPWEQGLTFRCFNFGYLPRLLLFSF